MRQSDDPMLQWIGDWFLFSSGRSSLLRQPGADWREAEQCKDGASLALCALRNEAANTDWYSDMAFKVNEDLAWAECATAAIAVGVFAPEAAAAYLYYE